MCFGIRKKKAFRIYQSQSQLCVGRRGVLTDRQTDIFLLLLLLLIRRIRLHKHNHDRNIIIIFGYTLSRFLKEDLCLKERKGDLLWLPPLNLASSANISPFTTSFHPFLQCVWSIWSHIKICDRQTGKPAVDWLTLAHSKKIYRLIERGLWSTCTTNESKIERGLGIIFSFSF